MNALPDPSRFLEQLFNALSDDGIDVSAFELDHLCYRVETMERYAELQGRLLEEGSLLGEHEIGGRPIATVRLHVPFTFQNRTVAVIELPAPKAGSPSRLRSKSYPEGYEHAEFVVNMEPTEFAARYPALDWDLSGAHKTVNADVRRNYDGCSVKFHRLGLAEVIALEKGEEPFELPRQPKLTPRTAPDPPPGPAALL